MGEAPPAEPSRAQGRGGRWRWYYILAVLLRLLAVTLQGYIHPDEFHQTTEVAASDIMGLGLKPPWEFSRANPCRSSLVPLVMAWLPFRVLVALKSLQLSPWLWLLAPRIFACAFSFLLDACAWRLANALGSHQPSVALAVATAWPTLLMSTRPLSNSAEAVVVAVSLVLAIAPPPKLGSRVVALLAGSLACLCVGRFPPSILVPPVLLALVVCTGLCIAGPPWLDRWGVSFLAGALVCLGVFMRFTTALFTLPLFATPLLGYIPESSLWLRKMRTPRGAAFSLVPMLLGFLTTAVAAVQMDSVYFGTKGFGPLLGQASIRDALLGADSLVGLRGALVVAPINSFLYNMSSKNLEEHGIHPRLTHIFVNMPMLFGPLAFVGAWHMCIKSSFRKRERGSSKPHPALQRWARFIVAACSISGLLGLSLAPHQEPRFLLPLIVPMCVFFGGVVSARGGEDGVTRAWLVFNAVLLFFFGVLHQGGVTRAAIGLSRVPDAGRVVWWQTYMPPVASLIQAPAKSRGLDLWTSVDVAGGSGATLFDAVAKLSKGGRVVYVVSPAPARAAQHLPPMCVVKDTYFPHISTEILPDFFQNRSIDLLSLELFRCGK